MSLSTIFVLAGVLGLVAIAALLPLARRVVLLLTVKYLLKRRLAWVSLVAVALCTALVLVVLSVMGGWLSMFRSSFHTLTGDVIISTSSPAGFGDYEQMVTQVGKLTEVVAAVPVIETEGLLRIPDANWQHYVGVVGIPIDRIDRVWNFKQSLWLQHDIVNYEPGRTIRPNVGFDLWKNVPYQELAPKDKRALDHAGMILGASAIAVHKDAGGKPTWPAPPSNQPLNCFSARLTVVPGGELETAGSINAATGQFWVVDGSRTQTPQHDNNVYVPFDVLQALMNMTAYEYDEVLEPSTRPTSGPAAPERTIHRVEPARTSSIQIKIRDGARAADVVERVKDVVENVTGLRPDDTTRIKVQTWEEQQSVFLSAIEHEIAITTTLFALISIVAVFMIFCIFYTIVVEKTRDIGIVKAVGGSAWSVAQVFLTYGAAIGFVGGGLGVVLSFFFVRYINQIHGFISWLTGTQIYSSEVYAFDKLPDHLNWSAAIVIWIVGIFAAIVGAVLPAIRAARLNPGRGAAVRVTRVNGEGPSSPRPGRTA